MSKPKRSPLTAPANYEIHIRGYLDDSWSDRLGGMTILPTEDEIGVTVTTLRGMLPDQAALFGVLNALYDMRFPVLSVECQEVI